MKLDVARLCLDCEEVHERQHCPACGSEAFAFLTRWIEPSTEPRKEGRRLRPRSPDAQLVTENVQAYRQLLDEERRSAWRDGPGAAPRAPASAHPATARPSSTARLPDRARATEKAA